VRGASPNDKTLKHAKDSLSINRQEERGNSKQMEVVGKNLEDYVSRQKFQVFFFSSSFVIPIFFFIQRFPFYKGHMFVCCLSDVLMR